ncbi:MAG: MBL fold metallo-hydrolase [Dehalococcoidia bacterium]|jgi:phosphoribosyl 1,2-cyclic phosphodiesterase
MIAMVNLRDTILFLGTGGARFTVAKQLLATGGAWMNLGGTQILMDPGPGSLVYAIKYGCEPPVLDAIILSHKHLDHSVDINVMIEAMTDGGWKKRGSLYAPADAFNNGAVILPYVRAYPGKVEVLEEGKDQTEGDVVFNTPVKHIHQVETYGFVFKTPRHKFSWITDTKIFDSLASYYMTELVIINVLSYERRLPVDHLSLPEAEAIIREIKPKAAVLTHFGLTMWREKPWDIEQRVSDATGVRVIAARDGMLLDLDEMV